MEGESQPRTIAAFDFDGTITMCDTLLRFVGFRRGRAKLWVDFLWTLPLLVLRLLGLVGNERHKMAVFARAFGGMRDDEFRLWVHDFARTELPVLIRPDALRRIKSHQASGDRVVIVTASPIDWIVLWAKDQGIDDVVGSRAEILGGRVTGRLSDVNCYGAEKVRRLLLLAPDRKEYRLVAYGDSRGDKELLASADRAYYRRFQ